ncbi:MAG: hypothetical protein R3C10_03830 [Pirellulales bacterium]
MIALWTVAAMLVPPLTGCGSSEYEQKVQATAAKLRSSAPAAPAGDDAGAAQPAGADAGGQVAPDANADVNQRGGGYGSPVADSLLAPP